jgi:hypothetical protein
MFLKCDEKLVAILLTTTTTEKSPKVTGDNYYQYLSNVSFTVKIILNNEKNSRKTHIVSVSNVNRTRSHRIDRSTIKPIYKIFQHLLSYFHF